MRTIAGVSAYVQQEDLFTGVFTVEEQLNFNVSTSPPPLWPSLPQATVV